MPNNGVVNHPLTLSKFKAQLKTTDEEYMKRITSNPTKTHATPLFITTSTFPCVNAITSIIKNMQTRKTANQAALKLTNSTKLVLTKKRIASKNEIKRCINLFSPKIFVFARIA